MCKNGYNFAIQLRKVQEACIEISAWSKELGYIIRPFFIYAYDSEKVGGLGDGIGVTKDLLPRRPVNKDDLEFMMTYWN